MATAWNPGIAAVLSLVIPGAGQMYKGQIGNGLVWLVIVVIGYMAFVGPGVVLHLCCIIGAASGRPTSSGGGVGLVLGLLGFVIIVGALAVIVVGQYDSYKQQARDARERVNVERTKAALPSAAPTVPSPASVPPPDELIAAGRWEEPNGQLYLGWHPPVGSKKVGETRIRRSEYKAHTGEDPPS
jgi:hypothetical protein